MTAGHMPQPAIPTRSTLNPAPISQRQRLALIRKALSDESIPDRVTPCSSCSMPSPSAASSGSP